MFRIRPIQEGDFDAFLSLAMQAQLGMTNLPKNPAKLRINLEKAIISFSEIVNSPVDHYYLFVLEDLENHHICGVSGILARTGLTAPLEYFRIKEETPPRLFSEVPNSYRLLERVVYRDGPSEVCSLFINPDCRGSGQGKLLSLSRFLFIAAFPERFTDKIFADMRGYIDQTGNCPFWNAIGKRFIPIEFEELMHRRDQGYMDVSELMPSSPIYLELLPQETVEMIGETHENTKPALQMLFQQGFQKTGEYDLYDSGPRVMADTKHILTIQNTHHAIVSTFKEIHSPSQVLISNKALNFRACLGYVESLTPESVAIDPRAAEALEISTGDKIQYVRVS